MINYHLNRPNKLNTRLKFEHQQPPTRKFFKGFRIMRLRFLTTPPRNLDLITHNRAASTDFSMGGDRSPPIGGGPKGGDKGPMGGD